MPPQRQIGEERQRQTGAGVGRVGRNGRNVSASWFSGPRGIVPGSAILGLLIWGVLGFLGSAGVTLGTRGGGHGVAVAMAAESKTDHPLPFYRVQPGDNLTRIAQRYGVRIQDLVAWNQLSDPDVLRVGQILAVTPPPTRQVAARGQLAVHASADEVEMLARLVQAEAGHEPFWGRVAVAAVVVNRSHHPGFPDTIAGVIRQPGQFPPVNDPGFARLTPDEISRAACITALEGIDPTSGALFFYNPKVVGPHEWWQDRPVQAVIGGHTFTL